MKNFYSFLLVFLPWCANSQTNCNLVYLTTIENFDVYEHTLSGAIIYRAKMSIDADGCPRAYGPNNSGLDWTANAGYPGNWWGIVTDGNGDPIIQGSTDPYPGMYVSSTSLVQSGYTNSNPLRYVDSENIPYIALPSSLQSLAGIAKGDLAFARNSVNGQTSYAYFADTGPSGKLGEASMYLAAQLGINSSPKTGGTSQGIIDYIVFPQSGMGQGTHLDIGQINSQADAEYQAAGGANLLDCISAMYSLSCENTIPLSCGVTYSGSSSTEESKVSTYGCNTWTETGPERVHSIIPSANGTITATLSNFTGDLDVYILGSCDPSDCLGTVSSNSATYTGAIAGQLYYIVVDADDGSGSAYDLVVTCPVSSSTDDLTLSNGSITQNQVVPGNTIDVSVDQMYSGSELNDNLPGFVLNYYLSTDCNVSPDDILLGTDNSELGTDQTTETETATLVVPEGTAQGNYYVLCLADANQDMLESNEGNNTLCLNLEVLAASLICTGAVPLSCGINYHGEASVASSNVYTYGCNSWTESGPERVHSIIPVADGTIAASLTNFTGDLDVYILASCDPSDCVGSVASSSTTYTNALAGVTYYIVVDADDGSGSAYDLVVSCPVPPQPEDLFLTDLSLSASIVEQGQALTVNVTQNYSGMYNDAELEDIDVYYYLSADCSLSGSDVYLGSDLSNIGSDFPSNVESELLTIPLSTVAGTYYILVQTDAAEVHIEVNEGNNVLCSDMLTVTASQASFGKEESIPLLIYPNPTSDQLHIRCDVPIARIELCNKQGQEVKSFTAGAEVLDLSDCSRGIYFLKVVDFSGAQAVLRIIKN